MNKDIKKIRLYVRGSYKKQEKSCVRCGSRFFGTKKAKYCSGRCNKAAQRDRAGERGQLKPAQNEL